MALLFTTSPFTTCCGLFLFSPTQVHGLSNLLPDPFFPTLPTFYLFFFFLLLPSPFLDGVFFLSSTLSLDGLLFYPSHTGMG